MEKGEGNNKPRLVATKAKPKLIATLPKVARTMLDTVKNSKHQGPRSRTEGSRILFFLSSGDADNSYAYGDGRATISAKLAQSAAAVDTGTCSFSCSYEQAREPETGNALLVISDASVSESVHVPARIFGCCALRGQRGWRDRRKTVTTAWLFLDGCWGQVSFRACLRLGLCIRCCSVWSRRRLEQPSVLQVFEALNNGEILLFLVVQSKALLKCWPAPVHLSLSQGGFANKRIVDKAALAALATRTTGRVVLAVLGRVCFFGARRQVTGFLAARHDVRLLVIRLGFVRLGRAQTEVSHVVALVLLFAFSLDARLDLLKLLSQLLSFLLLLLQDGIPIVGRLGVPIVGLGSCFLGLDAHLGGIVGPALGYPLCDI
jgi:hypothetical protein